MSHRILVVDDDDDFRSLLSDLYHQADYDVSSLSNPIDALKILGEESFHLCVTDQSMPELKGVDFIEKLRQITPNMPVIMVSAYLEDELMEKLKRMRIEVFHKPLNIMSLLRKTSELINLAEKDPIDEEPRTVAETPIAKVPLSDSRSFKSFALKSDASKRLKKEFDSIGSEVPNLVLVGDPGTHFYQIAKDIENLSEKDSHFFIYLNNRKTNVFEINKLLSGQPASKTLVFVVYEAFDLGVAQKDALLKLYKKNGPFSGINNPIRFVFCLHEDLDTQFAQGAIDEDFYLILGQKEIYLPRLNLCKEDIPYLAVDIAESYKTEHPESGYSDLDKNCKDLLMNTEWDRNYESLKAVMFGALKSAGSNPITLPLLTTAIENPEKLTLTEVEQPATASPAIIHEPQKVEKKEKTPAPVPKATEAAPKPKVSIPKDAAIIDFQDLENESELARNILKGKLF